MKQQLKKQYKKIVKKKALVISIVAYAVRFIPFKKIDFAFGGQQLMSLSELKQGCNIVNMSGCGLVKVSSLVLTAVAIGMLGLFVYKNYKTLYEMSKIMIDKL